MANKRFKDLATTATAPAADDYFAIDGATLATRNILAARFAVLVAVPATGTTAGLPGQFAFGGGNLYIYTGDGVAAHSWMYSPFSVVP